VPRVSPPDGLPLSQIPSQEVAAQISKINEELAGIKEELRSLKQKIDQQNKTPGPVSSEMAETRKQPAGPRCFMIKAKNYMAINQSRHFGSVAIFTPHRQQIEKGVPGEPASDTGLQRHWQRPLPRVCPSQGNRAEGDFFHRMEKTS